MRYQGVLHDRMRGYLEVEGDPGARFLNGVARVRSNSVRIEAISTGLPAPLLALAALGYNRHLKCGRGTMGETAKRQRQEGSVSAGECDPPSKLQIDEYNCMIEVLSSGLVEFWGPEYLVSDQETRIEPHSELTDEANRIFVLAHALHESFRSGLSNAPEILDEIGLVHPNAPVLNSQGVRRSVRVYTDPEIIGRAPVSQGQEALLVACIRGVRNELTDEYVLVRV